MGFLNQWKPLLMSLYMPMTAAEAATVKVTRTCVTGHSLDLEPSSFKQIIRAFFSPHHKTKERHVLV